MEKNILRHSLSGGFRALRASLAISILALTGCATGLSPATLRTPAHADRVTLTEVASYTVLAGLFKVPWSYTLQPGVYTAEKEDAGGTYFRGPPGSVAVHMGDPKGPTWHHTGGIWLPRDASKSPRMYHYGGDNDNYGDAMQAGGAIGAAFLAAANKAEDGKILLDPSPADATFGTTVRSKLSAAAQ
ncbi:hypothetical protein [Luteibacter aegosomatissinici]|uniref:hypothetical protein n=1 Tax=Luteibacter aegosomatissinici TaxID=2911539 RepID=UPI001FF7181A|nr:hypothetical protein [Luteibacter aegosomatissinici]UPG93781.1 hypothetical protein L2Y97_18380 [Luteibacter aegosomatissinici]